MPGSVSQGDNRIQLAYVERNLGLVQIRVTDKLGTGSDFDFDKS